MVHTQQREKKRTRVARVFSSGAILSEAGSVSVSLAACLPPLTARTRVVLTAPVGRSDCVMIDRMTRMGRRKSTDRGEVHVMMPSIPGGVLCCAMCCLPLSCWSG